MTRFITLLFIASMFTCVSGCSSSYLDNFVYCQFSGIEVTTAPASTFEIEVFAAYDSYEYSPKIWVESGQEVEIDLPKGQVEYCGTEDGYDLYAVDCVEDDPEFRQAVLIEQGQSVFITIHNYSRHSRESQIWLYPRRLN
jgi:hypothetical protein